MKLKLKPTKTLGLVSASVVMAVSSTAALGQEQRDTKAAVPEAAETEAPAFFRLDYSGDPWERVMSKYSAAPPEQPRPRDHS